MPGDRSACDVEVTDIHQRAFTDRGRAENHVLQLPHIARPAIAQQRRVSAGCQAAHRALDLSGLLLIAEQIIIGALLGLSLQLFFQAFVVAGQIVAIQMGMGFASMVDPANGVNVAVIGQFFTMLVTLLFLSMNGHLVVFEVLTESFTTLPVGGGLLSHHYWEIANKLGWVLGAALLLVLPAITALLVVNIAFGVMTRAAPQLNIFAIGFPLTLVLGMVILWISMADILNQYQPLASEALQFLRELAQAK